MRTLVVLLALFASIAVSALDGRGRSPRAGDVNGTFIVRLILHPVGEETFSIASNHDGTRTLTTTFDYTDRGTRRTTTATLTATADERPLALEVKGPASAAATTVTVRGATTTTQVRGVSTTTATPAAAAAVTGPAPFALQLMMMRAWHARGEPRRLQLIGIGGEAEPLEIARAGRDAITIAGRRVLLDRYTVNHLMLGREIVWTTDDGELAAAMTFAGGLPMEVVRKELDPAFPDLYRAGVAQQMADLAAMGREAPPLRSGAFAITGATLVDGVAAAPVPDAVVVVRDGRIAAAGPRATTPVPRGLPVVDGHGQTLLAGLWEMHTHASGVEFGPAHLAAGITTARDLGGEMDFLIAARDAVEKQGAIGPRLLLAGLVDAGGARAFGHVTAETAEEGRAVVARYHAAGFQQIKLYTFLAPDVIAAIAAEAHRLGMTVTGHVPQALTTTAGIEAGMDQINHLNYITRMLRAPGSDADSGIDLQSDAAKGAIQFLLDHHTVVDPTASWGEMASHSGEVDVASFEPGILLAPAVLNAKFRGMQSASSADAMRARLAQNLAVIGALHRAGVPIVPGSDTGLVGYGLHREIELYVQAGMTPLEAIQSATIVSARAMGLDRDAGSVEAGKRADLILVDGDPLQDVRALRRVTRVVANGRLYDTAALWRSVGFRAPR